MRALCRFLSRALFAIAAVTLLVGVIVLGLAVYLGTWPARRLARETPAGARMAAVQELLVAIAGAVAVFRSRT